MSEAPSIPRQSLNVLIVEDSPEDAELMVQELRRCGFDPAWHRVETESEYIAYLEKSPEIILADYSLPQFSGVRALHLLQERGLAIPFLVVSGTIGEEGAAEIMKHGASDYMLKGHLSPLGEAVMRALQGRREVAYFSMEIALESGIPTYGGGLGVLAGDTISSAADLQVPMIAISLLHRKGHFHQRLDSSGLQSEEPAEWKVERFLSEMPARVSVDIEGRTVHLRSWKYQVQGSSGYSIPVYLLDSDLPENSPADRTLTHVLYGGDSRYRLCQEVVLGIGGVRMLRALGYDSIERFHMNEGHASLLTLELLREQAKRSDRQLIDIDDVAAVRQRCIFTTHTPVPAGHDQFPLALVSRTLGHREDFSDIFCPGIAARVFGRRRSEPAAKASTNGESVLNMTHLGLNMSRYVNGVAKKHGEVSRLMFAGYQIDAITNGVHAATWTSPTFQTLYDRHIPDWREDNFSLRHAESIPTAEVWDAHLRAKTSLLTYLRDHGGPAMDLDTLTIGFARRATAYKRADLLFTDVTRLIRIAQEAGPFQVIYAGKAHPSDQEGKRLIQRIFELKERLKDSIKIAFIADYDVSVAKQMVAGVDLWLNTPQAPLEASGTSGMKAALNGIPSLSILDGWWVEGLIEGVTGWAIGEQDRKEEALDGALRDALCLYDKLALEIIPIYYGDRNRFVEIMRHAIALNGSFFNTQRMLQEYVVRAYFR